MLCPHQSFRNVALLISNLSRQFQIRQCNPDRKHSSNKSEISEARWNLFRSLGFPAENGTLSFAELPSAGRLSVRLTRYMQRSDNQHLRLLPGGNAR